MVNTHLDQQAITQRLQRLDGLTPVQVTALSQTINPVIARAISDSLFAELVGAALPALPLNPDQGLPLGLPGAVLPARFAGGTDSGPPTTGDFQTGDFVVSRADGTFWVCTGDGSPGVWTAQAGVSQSQALAALIDVDLSVVPPSGVIGLIRDPADGIWKPGVIASTGGVLTDEQLQDLVGAMFTGSQQNGITAAYNDGSGKIDMTVTAVQSGGGGTSNVASVPGVVALDSFTGANDDAKLAAAMTYAAAQTYKPAIALANRLHTFTQQRTLYSGFRLLGPGGPVEQVRTGTPIPCQVNLAIGNNNGWLVLPAGNTYGVHISGIAFQGNSSTRFLHPSTAVLWTSTFRDLSFNLFLSVLGSPTQQALLDACQLDGWWNVNNGYDTQFTIGGSDNALWPGDTLLLDTNPASITSMAAGTNFLMRSAFNSKGPLGPVYATCDRNSGLLITGDVGGLMLHDGRWEGRNATTPCYGSLIRQNSGATSMRDQWYGYAMSNPSATGRNDAGVIHVAGGSMSIDGGFYARATGVAESVPFAYCASGARLRVSNIQRSGTWTGKPVVAAAAGSSVSVDDSVTLVNV